MNIALDAQKPTATCPHCGERFTALKAGKIPTHDFPRPCRAVCPGTGEQPKLFADTPLWKDDPNQRARDFFEAARTELLVCGFAVVKQMAEFTGLTRGATKCPLCGNEVRFLIAPSNSNLAAQCATKGCISARE